MGRAATLIFIKSVPPLPNPPLALPLLLLDIVILLMLGEKCSSIFLPRPLPPPPPPPPAQAAEPPLSLPPVPKPNSSDKTLLDSTSYSLPAYLYIHNPKLSTFQSDPSQLQYYDIKSHALLIIRRLRSFQRSTNASTPRNLLLTQTLIPIITKKIQNNTLGQISNTNIYSDFKVYCDSI